MEGDQVDKQDTIAWVIDALDEGFALITANLTPGWHVDGIEFGGGVTICLLANNDKWWGKAQVKAQGFQDALDAVRRFALENPADDYILQKKKASDQRRADDFFDEEYN